MKALARSSYRAATNCSGWARSDRQQPAAEGLLRPAIPLGTAQTYSDSILQGWAKARSAVPTVFVTPHFRGGIVRRLWGSVGTRLRRFALPYDGGARSPTGITSFAIIDNAGFLPDRAGISREVIPARQTARIMLVIPAPRRGVLVRRLMRGAGCGACGGLSGNGERRQGRDPEPVWGRRSLMHLGRPVASNRPHYDGCGVTAVWAPGHALFSEGPGGLARRSPEGEGGSGEGSASNRGAVSALCLGARKRRDERTLRRALM